MKTLILTLALFSLSIPAFAGEKESVYDRVIKSGKIKCGYVLYDPAVIKDPNTGEYSGFAYEIINKMAKNLELEVDWVEEVGTGVMLEGLQTDRYDMICTPFWRNAERARIADFSKSLYYSPMGVWVRQDDTRFDNNLSKLNDPDMTLSVMDGTTLVVIAEQDFPQAQTLAVPQLTPLSDLMLNVANGKADAVPIDNYLARDYVAKNPGTLKDITVNNPVRVYPNGFVFKRDEYAFKAMIDAALLELINSGWADKTITKYEKYPNTFYRVVRPYQISK